MYIFVGVIPATFKSVLIPKILIGIFNFLDNKFRKRRKELVRLAAIPILRKEVIQKKR